jgi:hypothetical protein
MPVCATCDGSRTVIRGFHGEAITPKLGEAGTDDCPDCADTGWDFGQPVRKRRRSVVLWDQIEDAA